MEVRIDPSWRQALAAEWEKPYFADLARFVRQEYATQQVFPPAGRIFAAFDACPFDKVKVVILGQDPYHGDGQACGLSFGVNPGVAVPRSLANIYREMADDLHIPVPTDGDLSRWAAQGVLLLNATLTVRAHCPASHAGKGWEQLTDAAVAALNAQRQHLVYILWGSYAQRKGQLIDRADNLVIATAHPSPLSASRGFFGSRPFSRANDYLISHGIQPIDWG